MPRSEEYIIIQAPGDTVWSILTNPRTWPAWFPDVDAVTGFDPSTGQIQFQHHRMDGQGSMKHADKPQGVMVVNLSMDGRQTAHTFAIDRTGSLFGPHDSTTTLSYMLEYDTSVGFFRLGAAHDNHADLQNVRHTLEQVKAQAEGLTHHG